MLPPRVCLSVLRSLAIESIVDVYDSGRITMPSVDFSAQYACWFLFKRYSLSVAYYEKSTTTLFMLHEVKRKIDR